MYFSSRRRETNLIFVNEKTTTQQKYAALGNVPLETRARFVYREIRRWLAHVFNRNPAKYWKLAFLYAETDGKPTEENFFFVYWQTARVRTCGKSFSTPSWFPYTRMTIGQVRFERNLTGSLGMCKKAVQRKGKPHKRLSVLWYTATFVTMSRYIIYLRDVNDRNASFVRGGCLPFESPTRRSYKSALQVQAVSGLT